MAALWTDLAHPGVPIAEQAARALLVYGSLALGLRLAGKRELPQLTALDLAVLLLVAHALQPAIVGPADPLLGGVVGAGALLVANLVAARTLDRHGRLDASGGQPDVLVVNGAVQRARLARERITEAELDAAARRQGLASLDCVESCRLETSGALTFVAKRPTDDERRHQELVDLLRTAAAAQRELGRRLAALELREAADDATDDAGRDAGAPHEW